VRQWSELSCPRAASSGLLKQAPALKMLLLWGSPSGSAALCADEAAP